ncbi:seven transmembrane MLO family protein [Artemisia annua]|uniref:MLO-like protein n=1 Tax=Artemisia annua TaxID=35608 RepID=A0A2U1LG94_ARTAN|nr:seven transmembrane MLO family protein [Artemisia annua]
MVTEGGTPSSHTLEDTPTWALATVCFVFIFLGLGIEHLFHITTRWLKEHRKTALHEAVEKLKTVLMLLGLMSLILVVTQKSISKICIPNKVANSMLPCHKILNETSKTTEAYEVVRYVSSALFEPRALDEGIMTRPQHRLLASTSATSSNSTDHCASKGMTSFISEQGINQLNTFVCVLAIMQIVYSVATMLLGTAKMKSWKAWEQETQTIEYLVANDPNRFRFTRQTTFGKRHMTDPIDTPILLWIKCFFRQFFHSVAKVDYFTLRHGFISAHHLSTNNTFNFRKYIQRSLEDDFKVVVGISPLMWFLLVILMLIDVHGWHMYLWVSFLPLAIVLVLGTKLQVIVAKMALRLKEQNKVIIGAPLVTPNDELFWFSNPQFVLTLLHYTLFVNAFEFAFFVWVTLQYGIDSCFHETTSIVVTRVVLAVIVQVLCSYITLPLYALVTQMGSQYKSAILEDQTRRMIKQWHEEVKRKLKKQSQSPLGSPISKIATSPLGSPISKVATQMSSMEVFQQQRVPTLMDVPSRITNRTSEIVEEIQEA